MNINIFSVKFYCVTFNKKGGYLCFLNSLSLKFLGYIKKSYKIILFYLIKQ